MTNKKHNDPLEQFFRKKAGEYDIEYKEEDWLKLEERLDHLDQQNTGWSWRHLAAAVVIILFSILAFITYQQQLRINQLKEQLSQTENSINVPNLVQDIPADSDGSPKSDDGKDEELNNQQDNNELAAKSASSAKATGRTPTAQGELQSRSPSIKDYVVENSQNIARATISENNLTVSAVKVSPGGDGRYPAISSITPPLFNAQAAASENPRKNHSSQKLFAHRQIPKFTVGLLAGPDMSTVGGISNFYDPGHKLGLMLEYHINKNFAVSVGALHSKVRYTAGGNEYNPPSSYWTYNTIPEQTIGECILIDLPISLKYNFLHFSESRLYATAGASSYIMLDEEYRFNYKYNQQGLRQKWHERTGTRHWMSNATFSFGYELDVTPNLSLRAEPFIRLPLQEVGWGKVKLYSVGSFVSLNYNIY